MAIKLVKSLVLVLLLFISAGELISQTCTLSGRVTEASTGEELPMANIIADGNNAVSSSLDGYYSIELSYGVHKIEYSFVGFESQFIELNLDQPTKTKNIRLLSIELEEAQVFADIAIDRETPVAFTNIDARTVEEELASQDIPMLLNSAPGVYATQQGGGDGDARITIRGFDQRNVAVMLDGVPVNDMENGWVYWSNWFGLDAIMQTTQVQRGLGVSKLAIPSVGGTINIITKGIDQEKNTKIKQEVASNGFLRTTFGHTSGRLPGDWGFTVAGSYKQGNGWVKGNWTQGFFYYGKVQKSFGKHVLTLSGFGAPQSHGQRSFREGISVYSQEYASSLGVNSGDIQELGLNYNIHAGSLTRYDLDENGNQINAKEEEFNERKNYYHKPQFSLRHSWSLSDKFSISNVAYLSIGNGGGTRLDGAGIDLIEETGAPDFQAIYDKQTGYSYDPNDDPFGVGDPSIIPEISENEHVAYENFIKSSINNHFWYGLLSTFKYSASEKLSYSGGIDLRSYKGEHYREVYDLFGADYMVNKEVDDKNRDSFIFRNGDIIDYHNDAFVEWGGLFGQLEYKSSLFSGFLSGSLAETRYKRKDYFLAKGIQVGDEYLTPSYGYDSDVSEIVPVTEDAVSSDGKVYTVNSEGLNFQETDWFYRFGFTIKSGANYKLSEFHNVYLNLGYLDRAPRFQNVFDFDNKLFLDIQNEKIKAFEFGYGFAKKNISLNLNGYITEWKNRPVNRGVQIPDPLDPEEFINANINGMNARHMGVELEGSYAVSSKLTLEGVISLGDWIWNSEDTVYFFYDNNQPVLDLQTNEQVTRYFDARGVHVGDAAQTQLGGLIRYQFKRGAYAKLRYTYFDRYYANFDPTELNGESAGRDPWLLPDYQTVDFHAGYRINIGEKSRVNIRGSIFNILNTVYISDAVDSFDLARFNEYGVVNSEGQSVAQGFDAGSAGVFFGQGRRFNISATLSF